MSSSLGRLSVPLFAKLHRETLQWQTAAFRLAALLRRRSRERSPGPEEKELTRRFYSLLENEDGDEVFREFLVPAPAEDSALQPADGAGSAATERQILQTRQLSTGAACRRKSAKARRRRP